jgi:hypothetical protein
MIVLFALVIIPCALVMATMLFAYLLDRPQFAAAREALVRWKHRWLAYAIPFSPAVTMAILKLAPGMPAGAMPGLTGVLGILLSSIGSAALATCWLCLPDDPAQRPQMGYAALLSIVLWLLDAFVVVMVFALLR